MTDFDVLKQGELAALKVRIQELETQNKELRAYVKHKLDCRSKRSPFWNPGPCDCGLDKILTETKPPSSGPPDGLQIHRKYLELGGHGVFLGMESKEEYKKESKVKSELKKWIKEQSTK